MGSGTTAGGGYRNNRGAPVSINGVGLGAFQQGNKPGVAPKGVVNLTGAAGGLTSNNYSYDSQQSQVVFGLPETLSPGAYQLFLTDGAGGTSSKLALTITSAPPSFFILRNGPQLTVVGPNPVALIPGDTIELDGGGFGSTRGNGVGSPIAPPSQPVIITSNVSWSNNQVFFQMASSLMPGTYNVSLTTDSATYCAKEIGRASCRERV